MQTQLSQILDFLAYRLLLDKSHFDFCAVSKIRFQDWPDCPARHLAEAYAEMQQTHGHDMAAVQLSGYLDKLQPNEDMPADPGILVAYYESTLKEFKAKQLAARLVDDPLNAEKYILGFQHETAKDELLSFSEHAEAIFRESLRMADSGEAVVSLPRWPLLSNAIGGFNPGRVGMLLAQTGFGKSTAAVNLALCAASKYSVVYFNMEMLPQDFGEKLILASMRETFTTLKNAPRSLVDRFAGQLGRIYESKLLYSQGRAMTPQEIFAISRKTKATKGLDFLIVDYDQKLVMQTGKDTPEWKALQIAVEQFEVLAKELKCFVLILAQESGEGEVSGSKRSKFPASTVLRFFKSDDDKFVIQAVKNRFGHRNAAVEVRYESEKSFIEECSPFEPNEIRRESAAIVRSTTGMGKRGSTAPHNFG